MTWNDFCVYKETFHYLGMIFLTNVKFHPTRSCLFWAPLPLRPQAVCCLNFVNFLLSKILFKATYQGTLAFIFCQHISCTHSIFLGDCVAGTPWLFPCPKCVSPFLSFSFSIVLYSLPFPLTFYSFFSKTFLFWNKYSQEASKIVQRGLIYLSVSFTPAYY